jgi:hypothetical protein
MRKSKLNPETFFICAALLLLSGCRTAYVISDFESRTANHKTVTILPFEMIFSGIKPEQLTDAELGKIENAESKAFMISFYNEILQSTKGGKNPIRVDIQHFDKTISILNANGIDIRSSWREDPGKLAEILGVDAVVKARIEKYRLMSDLSSYGIDLGVHIISVISNYGFWFWMPHEFTKSKEVKTSYSLLDKQGAVLWSISYNEDADWREPANTIIDEINRKSAKTFPYRKSK